MQHDHRRRRARRHGRARRNHLRLSRRQAFRPARKRFPRRSSTLEDSAERSRRKIRRNRQSRWPRNRAASHLGHQSRHGLCCHRARSRSRVLHRFLDQQKPPRAPSNTWVSSPARQSRILRVDRVFIGSCTNSRIEDLRAAAKVVDGKHVAKNIKAALVVPGSRVVKPKPKKKASTKFSATPDSSGATRDAACASA